MASIPPDRDDGQQIFGSCPCSGISWISKALPSDIITCHCAQCRADSATKTPIAYGSLPNGAVHFSSRTVPSASLPLDSTAMNTAAITQVETERAIRGKCSRCGTLVYMKFHCNPESTELNMGLCSNAAVSRRVSGATSHIYFEGQVGQGEKAYRGLSKDLEAVVVTWEKEGRRRRADV